MGISSFGTGAASFLASAVEFVEALTIVLALGVTRGWRSSLWGAAAAIVILAVAVAAIGPSITQQVPRHTLQLLVGVLLLTFGLQWLRKAILRSTGFIALHDEDEAFAARRTPRCARRRSGASGSTGTRSRSPSRACCWRASRSCSSSSASGRAPPIAGPR